MAKSTDKDKDNTDKPPHLINKEDLTKLDTKPHQASNKQDIKLHQDSNKLDTNLDIKLATLQVSNNNNLKLLTLPSTLVKKLSRDNPELNTFLSRKKSSNTRTKLESKEYPKPEKSQNTEKKKELRPFPEK